MRIEKLMQHSWELEIPDNWNQHWSNCTLAVTKEGLKINDDGLIPWSEIDASRASLANDHILTALKIAVDEAEGWYDDCRGLQESEKMESLKPCYEVLKDFGVLTAREEKKSAQPPKTPI